MIFEKHFFLQKYVYLQKTCIWKTVTKSIELKEFRRTLPLVCSHTCILRLCQVSQQKSYSASSKIRFTVPVVCAGPLYKRSFGKTKGITAQILQIYFEFEPFFVFWSTAQENSILLTPPQPGQIFCHLLQGDTFCCACVVNNSNKLLFSFRCSCSKLKKQDS